MAQRHIQLFRNGVPSYDALRTKHQDVIDYLMGAGSPLTDLTVRDGELVLYRYKLTENGDIHTIVLAVSFPEGGTKTFEVVANYDHLTKLITDLDATKTGANTNNDITVTVAQEDGLLTSVTVSDTLKSVAHTGAAADVAVADAGNIIEATTVEGALAEIAAEINAMDYNVSDVEGFTPTAQGEKVKVTIQQKDGKITNVGVDETALENALDGLEAATTLEGVDAIEVNYGETNTVSLKIANGEQVLSQGEENNVGLKTTLAIQYNSTNKKIELLGINNQVVSSFDATVFIKDGMLKDAEIITASEADRTNDSSVVIGKRYIKFIFKTYQQGQEGEADLKVDYLAVEDLFDSYTAGNAWITIDQATNKISHAEVEAAGIYANNTGDVTVDSTAEKSFKVPTLTVDAAGHVTAASEKTVTISLPTSIDTAVQTVTSNEVVNATDKFVAVHATRAEGSNDVALTSELKIQDIATASAEANGLATALNVKEYVDTNSTTVSGYTKTTGEGESAVSTVVTVVESTENQNGSTNYQVKLPEITVQTPNATLNSMTNNINTHTYMTGIETDGFGRVTKVITETMTEDIDAGIYN